jgi:hypothetical protein
MSTVRPEPTGSSFAERLRALADLYDRHPDLPAPTGAVQLYISSYPLGDDQSVRDSFATARRITGTEPVIDDYYVKVDVGGDFVLAFSKHSVGSKRLVTRQVEEYVLLDEQAAQDDARAEALAEADAAARDLGYADDDARSEAETDAAIEELGR